MGTTRRSFHMFEEDIAYLQEVFSRSGKTQAATLHDIIKIYQHAVEKEARKEEETLSLLRQVKGILSKVETDTELMKQLANHNKLLDLDQQFRSIEEEESETYRLAKEHVEKLADKKIVSAYDKK